jgi:type IV secretory pathway VirB3-like protein
MDENASSAGLIADYPALRRPRLNAGVGTKTATMIWAITALVAVVIGLPWGLLAIPFSAVIHAGLSWFFKKDHQIMALYLVHEVVPNNLYAGNPSHGETWVSRPNGYANQIPLS